MIRRVKAKKYEKYISINDINYHTIKDADLIKLKGDYNDYSITNVYYNTSNVYTVWFRTKDILKMVHIIPLDDDFYLACIGTNGFYLLDQMEDLIFFIDGYVSYWLSFPNEILNFNKKIAMYINMWIGGNLNK